jgi:spore coat polysaccharide biosynthesis protein SpsF (cytidylyltransferase family)
MGSTRLPGKVLLDLGGETVLGRVVRRLGRAQRLDEIVVATTTAGRDDAMVCECSRLGVSCFRGSEQNVLDRYHGAALQTTAEVVVRITSDCPLIEPALVDQTIQLFFDQHADYASNVLPRTYPRGLDTEVFAVTALERAWREADADHQREHVTPYFCEHPELFRLVSQTGAQDYSRYRWTLDTAEDLELIRTIFDRFHNRDDFDWQDVIALMQREPELEQLNARVIQKTAHAS